jgi:hypothetical protein
MNNMPATAKREAVRQQQQFISADFIGGFLLNSCVTLSRMLDSHFIAGADDHYEQLQASQLRKVSESHFCSYLLLDG